MKNLNLSLYSYTPVTSRFSLFYTLMLLTDTISLPKIDNNYPLEWYSTKISEIKVYSIRYYFKKLPLLIETQLIIVMFLIDSFFTFMIKKKL